MQQRGRCRMVMCVLTVGLGACGKEGARSRGGPPATPAAAAAGQQQSLPDLPDLPRLKLLWQVDAGAGPLSPPVVGHGLVYVVRDSVGEAVALASGQVASKAD